MIGSKMSDYDGFFRAKVVDNVDEEQYGRVKIWLPDLMPLISDNEGIWARPANNPIGGRNDENESDNHFMGCSYIPAKGSWIWVFFEKNNINVPYYFGSLDLQNVKVLPECQLGNSPEKKWVIFKSHDGRTIVISDDPDDARVEITGKKRKIKTPPTGDTDSVYTIDENQTTILFDERDGKEKVLIRTHKGDFFHIDVDEQKLQGYFKEGIDLKSDGDIKITGKNMHLKATENFNQESSEDMNIKSGSKMNVESGAHMNLSSGSEINVETVTDLSLKGNGKVSVEASGITSISGSQVTVDPTVTEGGGLSQPARRSASAQGAESADPQGDRDT